VNRRARPSPTTGHATSQHVANLLLFDVLEQLAEKAMLLPFGRRPLVEVFGVRYALGGVCPMDLYHGDLWPIRHTDASVTDLSADGRGAPVLRIRDYRLQDARAVSTWARPWSSSRSSSRATPRPPASHSRGRAGRRVTPAGTGN
jgi:hypothetical protein